MDDDRSWRGESKVSFADAAKNAVKLAEADRGDEPTEYDVTLRVTGEPGSSLSEYIVVLRIPD
jgi:hypothetical protein